MSCTHGVTFPESKEGREAVMKHFTAEEVRLYWPRLFGRCRGCGFRGIHYASMAHFIAGDW